MAKILSFFQNAEDKIPHFILVRAQECPELYRLTPRVMNLKEDLYLLDLNSSQKYWQQIAIQKKVDLSELIEEVLRETYGGENLIVICEHPFQGLLLFQYFDQKKTTGIFYSETKISKNLYRALSWSHWANCAHLINQAFEKQNLLTKERKSAYSEIARLEKLMTSLGISSIGGMEQVDFEDLQRRFSVFIGHLWRWSFPDKFKSNEDAPLLNFALDVAILDFPWVQFKINENPKVKTHLEFPLTDWNHVKPELEDSLIKISRQKELRSPYRVMEFIWILTLYDLEVCKLPIHFKFPLDMEKEKENDFSTLLIQFEFAFQELNEKLKEKYEETDHVNCAYIIGWELEASQIIYPTSSNNDLFDDWQNGQVKFRDFQNKLKNPLQRFEVLNIHIPSLNFQLYQNEQEQNLSTILRVQPFHLLATPKEISLDSIEFKRFIERTSSNWWQEGDEQSSYRDYYMCEREGQIIYAYRDYQGKWYQHGIFS